MLKTIISCLILFSGFAYSQLYEGQNFCGESKGFSYFPLQIEKKKIFWDTTFYFETKEQTKTINGKTYLEFKQKWENERFDLIYFREENGIVYKYDPCCEVETVVYDPNFEVGHTWKTADQKNEYKVVTFTGTLKTPFCNYQNLLVIEAKMTYGTFNFYYLKGHGYIGATHNNKLVSCVSPIW